MGVWGTGNFENDTALDWIFELEDYDDISLIEKTVNTVFDDEYIESDIGSEALVAIEAIVRLKGDFSHKDAYAKELEYWVKHHNIDVPDTLIETSKKALELIVSNKSELYELWEETGEFESWKKEVNDLKERLNCSKSNHMKA